MQLFLALLDQFRYIVGVMVIVYLCCHRSLVKKEDFTRRAILSASLLIGAAFLYVPISHMLEPFLLRKPWLTAPYWAVMIFAPVPAVLYCFETNLPGALFRVMMGAFGENFITVLIKYVLLLNFFPDLPEKHTVLYICLLFIFYTPFFYIQNLQMRRVYTHDETSFYDKNAVWVFLFTYIVYSVILGTTKMVCENVVRPVGTVPALLPVFHFLRYFLEGIMLLLSVLMGTMLWYFYDRLSIRNEKDILARLVKERRSQYEFSRENIEMINRKSHDLKHQLRVLEQISDEERREKLRETRKAIDFYDAVVKTGNEALDTLLTEKNVYCCNRNIRLSCMVNTEKLGKIDLLDLYTLLGNAVDNAIESVERLSDDEKKTISLSVRDRGDMVYIHVENFYEGELKTEDGLPVTSKDDTENHGYGIKSMQSIAQKYGGNILIDTSDNIFSIQIILPT